MFPRGGLSGRPVPLLCEVWQSKVNRVFRPEVYSFDPLGVTRYATRNKIANMPSTAPIAIH